MFVLKVEISQQDGEFACIWDGEQKNATENYCSLTAMQRVHLKYEDAHQLKFFYNLLDNKSESQC